MDAIKKKMQSLKTETENAMARADQLDAEFRAATSLAEKTEESVGVKLTIQALATQLLFMNQLLVAFTIVKVDGKILYCEFLSFSPNIYILPGPRSPKEDAACGE